MAHYGHHERQDTDPIPLRRVVRQRPLTDQEIEAIYGRERYERVPQPYAPYETSSDAYVYAEPYVEAPVSDYRRSRDYSDEVVEIPMRRSRWGFFVVGLVLLGALALLGYAIAERSNLLPRTLVFGEPEVVFVAAEPIAERGSFDVSYWQSLRVEGSAEPNRGPGIEQAEAVPLTPKRAPLRAAPRRAVRPAPEPAAPVPAETPYPSLDPPPVNELEQPEPNAAPPPQPETAPEQSDEILRDPGF